jgi:chemotaxis protein CheX
MQTACVLTEQLQELVESTFSAMLALPIDATFAAAAETDSPRLAASVHITGAWTGTVLLTCTEAFGRRAAAAMLCAEPGDVTLADIHDAVAELANILGGGIKSILPGPSTLALPSVTHGSQFDVHIPRTEQIAQFDWSCDGQGLRLRVLQSVAS